MISTEDNSAQMFGWNVTDLLKDPVAELTRRLEILVALRTEDKPEANLAACLMADQLLRAGFCLDLAEVLLREVVAIDPSSQTLRLLAMLLRTRGDQEAAEATEREADSVVPSVVPSDPEFLLELSRTGKWKTMTQVEKLAAFRKAGYLLLGSRGTSS